MYTIELDTVPVELGFAPPQGSYPNAEGTFTVTRRFVHAQHYHSANYNYNLEAYCPCLTDNVEIYCYVTTDYRGRITYGISYVTNDSPKQNNEGGVY